MTAPSLGYTLAGASTPTTAPLPVQNTQASLTADFLAMYSGAGVDTVAINLANLLGIGSQVVSINDPQTLTQKTLDNTNAYTAKDTSFTLQSASSTTKRAQFLLSGITAGQTRVFTLPDYNATLATIAGAETFTNKTLSAPTITGPIITNATLSADIITGYTSSTNGSIFGMVVTGGTIAAAGIAAGAVTYSKVGTDSSFAWSPWTPVLANLTLGNGILDAKTIQIGKTVFFRFVFVLGSTSSVGTGPTFTLPSTPRSFSDTASGARPIGLSHYEHNGVTSAEGCVVISAVPTPTCTLIVYNAASTYLVTALLSATIPFTFGTGDSLFVQGAYETT